MKSKFLSIFLVLVLLFSMVVPAVSAGSNLSLDSTDEEFEQAIDGYMSAIGFSQYSSDVFSFYQSNKNTHPYLFIYSRPGSSTFNVLCSAVPIIISPFTSSSNEYSVRFSGNSANIKYKTVMDTGENFSYNYLKSTNSFDSQTSVWNLFKAEWAYIPYLSNHEIKSNSNSNIPKSDRNAVFFYQTEVTTPIISSPEILTPVLQGVHSLIPFLIVSVVGLVAFWKGWQLLSKLLRKA